MPLNNPPSASAITFPVTASPSGAATSGTPTGGETVSFFKINTPTRQGDAGRALTSPFVLRLDGAYFTDGALTNVWDPVLYYGYNADRADATQPCMRQVIEGDYRHSGRNDFEVYWEYVSSNGATSQRPIFYFHEKDGVNHGLVFNENNITIASPTASTDVAISSTVSGGSAGVYWQETGNRGLSFWAGSLDSGSGLHMYANPFANSNFSGALNLRANGASSASTNADKFSVNFYTGGVKRMSVHPDGKIAFYQSTDFTNFERLAINLASGTQSIAAESGGTGAANIDIAISPLGTGQVTLSSPTSVLTTQSNGQSAAIKTITELTTIAAAATTDTTILIPSNSIVVGVSTRVTVALPITTSFTVGDAGSAARYSTAAVSKALSSTDPGTKAGAYYNATATAVRITPDTTPSDATGRVRVTIHYINITPPTS